MATKIPIPKLGQSEETVTIASWQVKEGAQIKKGDVLFEVETDKAVLEVESQFEGTILKVVTPAGVEVPVMTTAAIIGEPGEGIVEVKSRVGKRAIEHLAGVAELNSDFGNRPTHMRPLQFLSQQLYFPIPHVIYEGRVVRHVRLGSIVV